MANVYNSLFEWFGFILDWEGHFHNNAFHCSIEAFILKLSEPYNLLFTFLFDSLNCIFIRNIIDVMRCCLINLNDMLLNISNFYRWFALCVSFLIQIFIIFITFFHRNFGLQEKHHQSIRAKQWYLGILFTACLWNKTSSVFSQRKWRKLYIKMHTHAHTWCTICECVCLPADRQFLQCYGYSFSVCHELLFL